MEQFPSFAPQPEPEKIPEQSLEKEIGWKELENHQFDESHFYRIVSEAGYQDFLNTGVLRSSPEGTDSHITESGFDIGHRTTAFPSFSKGAPDLRYTKDGVNNYIFETDAELYKRGDKNPANGNPIKGRHWAYRAIDKETGRIITEIKPDMIAHIYKLDTQGTLFIRE